MTARAAARAAEPEAPTVLRALSAFPFMTSAVLVIGVLVGAALPVLRPPVPVAETTLLLAAPSLDTTGNARAFVRAQAAVARLPLVSRQAQQAAAFAHPHVASDSVDDALRVVLAPGETGLVFRAKHPDPDVARTIATAAAQAYRIASRDQARAAAAAAIRRLDDLGQRLSTLSPSGQGERVREELSRRRVAAVLGAASADPHVVAEVPVDLAAPAGGRPTVAAGAGGLAAVIPAVLLGHARLVRLRRLITARALALAPAHGQHVLTLTQHAGPVPGWEVLGSLLPAAMGRGPVPVVAVLSTRQRDGAAVATGRLAVGATEAGLRVLVLDSAPGQQVTEPMRAMLGAKRRDRRRRRRRGRRVDAPIALSTVSGPRPAGQWDVALVPVPSSFAPAATARVLSSADAAVVLCEAGRRPQPHLWRALDHLALLRTPLLALVVPTPRWDRWRTRARSRLTLSRTRRAHRHQASVLRAPEPLRAGP